jgi:hypothetical protein
MCVQWRSSSSLSHLQQQGLQRDDIMIIISSTTSGVKVILVIKYSFWDTWAVERSSGWPTAASSWYDCNGIEAKYSQLLKKEIVLTASFVPV